MQTRAYEDWPPDRRLGRAAAPLSQVELAFCIRPVWGEMEPGTAMPMVASAVMSCMSLQVRSTMAAIVAA